MGPRGGGDGDAQELHVLREGVAEGAGDGVELLAVGEDVHVVVDEAEVGAPFGVRVAVELGLADAVEEDGGADEGAVAVAGVLVGAGERR